MSWGVPKPLEQSWERLGSLQGGLGGVLGASWGVLGTSWAPLWGSWGRLGSLLESFLGCLGLLLRALERILAIFTEKYKKRSQNL